MKEEKFEIKSNYDNLKIKGTIYKPEKEIKGLFFISHGMCEERSRYYDFMKYLAENDYVVIIHDHRGHGESVKNIEDLGYFKDEKGIAIVEDLHDVIEYFQRKYPKTKTTLFGHSMGSLVVRNFIGKYDNLIDELIICGSPSRNKLVNIGLITAKFIKKRKGEKYRSQFLEKQTTGSYDKIFKSEPEKNCWLSRDKHVVKLYNEGERTGFNFTTNGYINLFNLLKNTYKKSKYNVKNKDLKIFFIAGSNDPVIKNKESWLKAVEFMKSVGYSDVYKKLYKEMRHEILNEIGHQEVYEDILDFINYYEKEI